MESTTVINIRKANLNKLGFRDLEHWLEDGNHIYIGRNNCYVKGAKGSIWKNPFSVKKFGRDGCLIQYEEYLRKNKKLMDNLSSLKGKVLGCWCAPEGCHGDILVKLLKEQEK